MKKKKLIGLGIVSILAIVLYLSLFMNLNFVGYFLSLRIPKVVVMVIVAFAIGAASIVFQSIIQNTIVTPCLLGMNSLYTLIHTLVVFFFGSTSIFVTNENLAFLIDILLMGTIATFLYSFLFQKTKHNVLYVLLIGTIMTTCFSSIQSTLVRIMDPNEYDRLLTSLVPSLQSINTNIVLICMILMGLVIFLLRKELAVLDVITLGKAQAINLGVDYDKVIRKLLLGVALYIAIATAMVGPISFLGLIIANLSRQLFQTCKHSYLIVGSCLIGVIFLVLAQLVVEHVYTFGIPVSVFITIAGGIYFLYLLMVQRKA